jgi:N-acetylneuraminate synthase
MSIFIIAEIGINHNGDMSIVRELIDVAVDARVNAVKFQKREINLVYSKEVLDSPRESPWGSTQREQKQGLELSEQNYAEIDDYCKSKNIIWFASAWDLESQRFLKKFSCNYNKIASAMIVYKDLLKMVADEQKHTFISTGMSKLSDIDTAVEIFTQKNCPFELMHTNSTYPTAIEDINLKCIKTLQDRYQCNVGYSGHEIGTAVSQAAVGFGITSLERHITLDKTMYGSDQSASLEPNGIRDLVQAVRKVELALGDGQKTFSKKEAEVAKKLRLHLK